MTDESQIKLDKNMIPDREPLLQFKPRQIWIAFKCLILFSQH